MNFLKWTAVIVGVLGFVLWVASAALVMFWDPGGPLGQVGPRSEDVWIFPGGYTDSFESVSWSGDAEEPPDDAYREKTWLRRGPLDRETGRFPLALRFSVSEADAIAAVDLMVTDDIDRTPEPEWKTIGHATLRKEHGWCVATVNEAWAPADAKAYRVAVTHLDDEPAGGFSKSMPTAPTFLGRVYDHIAWWPAFRWLPDLR